MTEDLEDVGIDVDVKLDDDETPEEALEAARERQKQLYEGYKEIPEGHPQRKVVVLELRVLGQVIEQLRERVGESE